MSLSWKLITMAHVPSAASYTERVVSAGACEVGLDVGCGSASPLGDLRPRLRTIGLDVSAEAIDQARARDLHDHYLVADLLADGAVEAAFASTGERRPDIVTLYGVIEHVPKRVGFELLERCEALTTKYVLLETPNGFVPQGPEFGNEHQRHLSGWFPHDFEGRGYDVYGSTGLRAMLGYAAGLRWQFPGAGLVNAVGARLARIERHPRLAFNLVAIKDVRGVPARLG
jgi:SAM-dependent methyltransferase